ncbi:MAG: efflux RND transporter periplasmic adaptor subunit [Roseobacter sp.]
MSYASKTTFLQKAMKRLLQSMLTLGVMFIAGTALFFGVTFLGERAAAVPDPIAAPITQVSASRIVFESGYSVPRRFFGQIEASENVNLSFELGGRLETLDFQEGDVIAKGDEIARLDTDLLEADAKRLTATQAAAAAQLTFAKTRLERALSLQKRGFTSQETLDQAIAARDELENRIAETQASLDAVTINLQKSVLRAPFHGQIATQDADVSETVSAGQNLVTLMKTDQPELRVGIPLSIDVSDLTSVTVEIADQTVPATLKRLRPDLDPITRTRTAIFAFEPVSDLVFGQTAAVVLNKEIKASGTWIELDALQSGKGSIWTVLIVEGERLHPAAVEILHVDGARAFVRGSFVEGMHYVASGAHLVVPGQQVSVIAAGH